MQNLLCGKSQPAPAFETETDIFIIIHAVNKTHRPKAKEKSTLFPYIITIRYTNGKSNQRNNIHGAAGCT